MGARDTACHTAGGCSGMADSFEPQPLVRTRNMHVCLPARCKSPRQTAGGDEPPAVSFLSRALATCSSTSATAGSPTTKAANETVARSQSRLICCAEVHDVQLRPSSATHVCGRRRRDEANDRWLSPDRDRSMGTNVLSAVPMALPSPSRPTGAPPPTPPTPWPERAWASSHEAWYTSGW